MRIGILGAGFMGGTHARAFARIPGVEIVAIAARRRERAEALAAEVGGRAVTDLRAVIEDDSIAAVSNTLPTHLHPAATIAALDAGKHVLLEKPFALTAADCDGMIAAAARAGRVLMIAHVLRFWGEYVALAGLVGSGRIGAPVSASAFRLSQPPAWGDWFPDPGKSGGAVLDLAVHDFDALNWILGTPRTAYGRGRALRPGLWNDVQALLDYGHASGAVEGSATLPAGHPFTCGLKVHCEGGVVAFAFEAGGAGVEVPGRNTLTVREDGRSYPLAPPAGDAYRNQIGYFVAAVRAGRTPELGTPEQARLAVRTADAVRQSLETGKVVAI